VTNRKRPPPSKSFWGFSVVLIVLILASVSGAILLAMGFSSFLGVSVLVWGYFGFKYTPKMIGLQ